MIESFPQLYTFSVYMCHPCRYSSPTTFTP